MRTIPPAEVRTVAEIGMGTVGSSWTALMLAKGYHVQAFDPAPGAQERAEVLIGQAWPALRHGGLATDSEPPLDRLCFCASIAQAVDEADVIQESTPEILSDKGTILEQIDAHAGAEAVVLSSTGGILPSELQTFCSSPERFIVFHPFNPTHLIPLIEIVPGRTTSADLVDWAVDFARHIGKKPVVLKAELSGHMTNRLQFALVREAVRCIVEGVATAEDVDNAVRHGLAPRWMLMGGLQTLHLAGGHGGMQAILDHAGTAIETWWQPGTDIRLTPDIRSSLVQAANDLWSTDDLSEWMSWRDTELVTLLNVQAAAESHRPGNTMSVKEHS